MQSHLRAYDNNADDNNLPNVSLIGRKTYDAIIVIFVILGLQDSE